MKKLSFLAFVLGGILLSTIVSAQIATNKRMLELKAASATKLYYTQMQRAYALAKLNNWDTVMKNQGHGISRLVGVDINNHPIYYTTFDNLIAATTTGTSQLWPGGSSGLSLSGSPSYLKNKLGIWDGGGVLGTHKELAGRVTQMEGFVSNTDEGSIHATHVTGTLMATGINPAAKGMSFNAPGILAYLFNNDIGSITAAAPNLILSNHSYGTICGWHQDENGDWYFEGNNGDTADFKFGYYNSDAASLDYIAYNAPNYLIVKAAGNNRNVNGPSLGGTYNYYDNTGAKVQTKRNTIISNNDSYKTIGTSGNAKNILTVGAVGGLPNGYKTANDVVMTPFSSWGPTNDGRIKPDIVADGLNVLSCSAANDSAYTTLSGTSMATPNVSGSLFLLQDYYSELKNGAFLRSATLKGLAIHTANEAGDYLGPDYKFGWGLLNVAKAAEVIKNSVTSNNASTSPDQIYENVLKNGETYTLNVVASGKSPITATICWTDPEGNVVTSNILNNNNKELVNDLDIRITKGAKTYFPWILNPFMPTAAATKGDNHLDNVEKIEVDSIIPGQVYTITVSHKVTLANGAQAYSLLVSGVGGNTYCSVASAVSNGASIKNVFFAGINYTKTNSCNTYNDLTNMAATIKPNKTTPLAINVGSCDGISHNKTVNVFIDYNSNGSFLDSGEMVATGKIAGVSNNFSAIITPPNFLTIGTTTLMRIVAIDTANADTLSPCNTNLAGEIQDYLVNIAQADNDISVSSIVSPTNGDNPDSKQLLVVQLTNNGSSTQQNINLTAKVKSGNTVIATLNGNYPSPIANGATVTYTFQQPFNLLPAKNYSIVVTVSAPLDDIPSNNILVKNITTASPLSATVNICNGNTNLKVNNLIANTTYNWYENATSSLPIATSGIANLPYALKDSVVDVSTGIIGNVGPTEKGNYAGGYQEKGNNYLNYTSSVPVILQCAKLYTKYPGKVTIMAADIISTSTSGTYTYKVLNTKTIDVYATNPLPASSSVDGNDPLDAGAIFYINMDLPAGKHSIIIAATDATLFRSKGLPMSGYPYSLGSIFSITSNSASNSNPTDTNFYKPYYYYLYNMKIKTKDCVGDRIQVSVYTSPRPFVSYSNDSLKSSIKVGNQWYLDGVAIVGATGNTYKPQTVSGNYYTVVTDSNGCQRKSNIFSIDKIVPNISSNLNRGSFNLSFYVNVASSLQISLLNSAGKLIFMKSYPSYQGYFSQLYGGLGLASGVYILQIQHGSEIERKKIVIVP